MANTKAAIVLCSAWKYKWKKMTKNRDSSLKGLRSKLVKCHIVSTDEVLNTKKLSYLGLRVKYYFTHYQATDDSRGPREYASLLTFQEKNDKIYIQVEFK